MIAQVVAGLRSARPRRGSRDRPWPGGCRPGAGSSRIL